ncbi:hypothetical protein ACFQWE_50835 [Nonomuraea recticatena]|uniref:hypothetical protein n=1 Tax=Nonomuraea recticatena TaxID=46178 RepID=UPI00360C447F
MLYLAIKLCAAEVNVSASASYVVDSALASSARTRANVFSLTACERGWTVRRAAPGGGLNVSSRGSPVSNPSSSSTPETVTSRPAPSRACRAAR